MKKTICLLLLAVAISFLSCKDKTNEFAEQHFTTNQISSALKDCITLTSMRTANTLCIVDSANQALGFYKYQDSIYRLVLPPSVKAVVDTLTNHGYENTIDSLIFNMNRAAEKTNNKVKQFWEVEVESITFPNPNQLLYGGSNAITKYVKETKQSTFISELISSILKEQFDILHVVTTWNELQLNYLEITSIYSSFDILASTAQQMAEHFFAIMAIEEAKIRKDPSLRGSPNGILFKVFANL